MDIAFARLKVTVTDEGLSFQGCFSRYLKPDLPWYESYWLTYLAVSYLSTLVPYLVTRLNEHSLELLRYPEGWILSVFSISTYQLDNPLLRSNQRKDRLEIRLSIYSKSTNGRP